MAMDPYAPCPCGSGKKFKWCCEPIEADVVRAFTQEERGQHEAALRIMDEVTAKHAGNPEAWGRKAELLAVQGKLEEADAALQKAFDINPNYPHGLLLRAQLRLTEGEINGALLLARKAADAYDPGAADGLARVYSVIHECESRLRRPIAARAALRILMHLEPSEQEVRQHFEAVYGPKGSLPACVRREYALRRPATETTGARRAAWDRVLGQAGSPRLSELARAFAQLTQEDANDGAAWFNLGLARAWLGDNRAAIEALERALDLEGGDGPNAETATLIEALRCGPGLEDECDYHEYGFALQMGNFQALSALLQEWQTAGRLLLPPREREDVFFAMVLDTGAPRVLVTTTTAGELHKLAGYVMISGPMVRFWGPSEEGVKKLLGEVREKLKVEQLNEAMIRPGPPAFHDVVTEALVFPSGGGMGDALTGERIKSHARMFYEDTWPSRPRRSLRHRTPADAAQDAALRKRLLGVVQFLEDCGGGVLGGYDFAGLRRKLGLPVAAAPEEPAAAAPTAAAPAPAAPALDIASLDAAGLAALTDEALGEEQLEQAYQAAQKLGQQDLRARFARALVARPHRAERPDRFLWYSFLVDQALRGGQLDAALDLVNDGERHDCENNEGRRRNDYELRRGQVHARRGEGEAAEDVFRRLIERVPTELKYRGPAAEALLSGKQPDRALRIAEEGVTQARKQNDRDTEQHLLELIGAARKQLG